MTRVLIIYETMGNGHYRMARTLEECLEGEGIEIEKRSGSELMRSDMRAIVWLWNFLLRNNLIRTADVLINFMIRLFVMPVLEITTTRRFFRELETLRPDIVVTTADAYGKVLGMYSRRNGLPFFIVLVDVSVFIDLTHPDAQHICFFEETAGAIRSFDFGLTYFSFDLQPDAGILRRLRYVARYLYDFGIRLRRNSLYRAVLDHPAPTNGAVCHALGPLAESRYFGRHNQREARQLLGLPEEGDLVIVVSGSIGGRFVHEALEKIEANFDGSATVVAACGTAHQTREAIERRNEKRPPSHPIQVVSLGFIDNFERLLAAADCIVMRPSAGVFVEAILSRTPVIALESAPSNDRGTLAMIRKHGVGVVCGSLQEVGSALATVLRDKQCYDRRIEDLLSNYPRSFEAKRAAIRRIILGPTHAQ